jgi:hypothetical protein
MADRAKFLDFMDMIDGGGRGQMGGEFKGGGIFSELANLIATPYGSEDPERRRRLQERRRARGLLDMDAIGTKEEQAAAASRAAATPSVVRRAPPAPMMGGGPTTRGGQRGPRVAPAGPPMPATAMSPVMPNQPMSTYDQVMPQANPMAGLGMGPATRGGRRGGAVAAPAVDPRIGTGASGFIAAPAANAEYAAFMSRVKNDPMFAGVINNPQAMQNIFRMYQQQTMGM